MDDIKLVEELSKHPELRKHVERLLRISSNLNEEIALADEAEEAAIQACRSLGKAALQSWGEARAEQTAHQIEKRVNKVNKHIKKKFAGEALLEK